MKAYRWMSIKEFQKVTAGCDITPIRRNHKYKTTGAGIFFLPEDYFRTWLSEDGTDYVSKQPSPEFSIHFLSGIVTTDVLVEFDICCPVEEAQGVYANPYTDEWYDYIVVDELCIPFYNQETMIPLRYFISESFHKGTWYVLNGQD